MNMATIETPVRLSLTRSFDAAPETLFDAWLQQSWGDWTGPEGAVCLSCEIDPRVGGQWRIHSRRPDGSEFMLNGTYKEITRPSRLVFSWNDCFSGPQASTVILTFKSKGAGTEMTLSHEGFASDEQRDRHNDGWSMIFERLARYCLIVMARRSAGHPVGDNLKL
jgi:uncharacterized protein YndB with AHSA1/START domain